MGLFLYFLLQLTKVSCDKVNQTVLLVYSSNYKLMLSDEFNTDGPPDLSKWEFESGFVRNEEAQWYHSKNAVCEGGYLVITGKKEEKPNPNYLPRSNNWKTKRRLLITYLLVL